MIGFACDGGGAIAARTATASSIPARNMALGFPTACSIVNQNVLSHLGETRLAELVINQREQCRHDRTPLFDRCGKLDWQLFQDSFAARRKRLLQRRKLFRSEHVKEISSRVCGNLLRVGGTLAPRQNRRDLLKAGIDITRCVPPTYG